MEKDQTKSPKKNSKQKEKKAVAYIDSSALLELLKMPYKIELVSLEYPTQDDKVRIVIKGEPLPVKATVVNSKSIPEVSYQIKRHWHNANILLKEPTKE